MFNSLAFKFIVRVELHHAKELDYEKLHAAMRERSFFRLVNEGEGTVWLPPAEFHYDIETTVSAVLELAKAAAGTTGKKFGVIVTKVAGFGHFGLEP